MRGTDDELPVRVEIAGDVLESVFDECDSYDHEETGGRVIGHFAVEHGRLVIRVTGVIDAGPGARRTSTSLFQDGDYQADVFRRIEAEDPAIEHLGNWHTHHVNRHGTLSDGDVATYRRIVNHELHNLSFFYALLVTHRDERRSGLHRYAVRHYVLFRGDDTVHEIKPNNVKIKPPATAVQPPDRGLIFWPVGVGDSTTIRVAETVYMQVDIRHVSESDLAWPVIDKLIELLPTHQGEPCLSVFVLTHPGAHHCQGFEELSGRATISELWMSPRTFREFRENDELCDDARAFHDEAMRRVQATVKAGGDPGRGHRIRIIGHDELLEAPGYEGFPSAFLTIPGQTVTTLDGEDRSDVFEAFVHAPVKDDAFDERNGCSLAFQISLHDGDGTGRALFLGDLGYPGIRRIFDRGESSRLEWNVLLAPRHCSKSAMYWRDEGEDDDTLRFDIVRDLGEAALSPGYIVSSSDPVPETDEPRDSPPHVEAKKQYARVVPDDFICTHGDPGGGSPGPVIFEVTAIGLRARRGTSR